MGTRQRKRTIAPWAQWLRKNGHDLGWLTGQDGRALTVIAAAWELYAVAGTEGQAGALLAVVGALRSMQRREASRILACELIAYAMDWPDRARLWPLVAGCMETAERACVATAAARGGV